MCSLPHIERADLCAPYKNASTASHFHGHAMILLTIVKSW